MYAPYAEELEWVRAKSSPKDERKDGRGDAMLLTARDCREDDSGPVFEHGLVLDTSIRPSCGLEGKGYGLKGRDLRPTLLA